MDGSEPRQPHDIGGVSIFIGRPIEPEPHALSDFDREVDALRQVFGTKRIMSVDELRRGVEAIPEPDHHRLGHHERWIRSIADNLLRCAVVTKHELAAALAVAGEGVSQGEPA